MPEVSIETFGDYLAKTKQCYSLNEISDLKDKYTIISEEEEMRIIRDRGAGWERFYRMYPTAIGFIYLGRIGFNKERDQALLLALLAYDVDKSRGAHVLLSKKDGRWTIEQKYQPWNWAKR